MLHKHDRKKDDRVMLFPSDVKFTFINCKHYHIDDCLEDDREGY